jgi:hypothetical protein
VLSEPLVIDYGFTEEDLATFLAFHTARSPLQRRMRRMRRVLWPALYLAVLSVGGFTRLELVGWVVVTIFLLAVFFPLWERYARGRLLEVAKRDTLTGVIGPHRLTLDDQGVEVGTPYGALRVYWHGIQEIVLSADQVLFYNGLHTAMIVPRRVFESDREAGSFVGAAHDRRNAAMARGAVA